MDRKEELLEAVLSDLDTHPTPPAEHRFQIPGETEKGG